MSHLLLSIVVYSRAFRIGVRDDVYIRVKLGLMIMLIIRVSIGGGGSFVFCSLSFFLSFFTWGNGHTHHPPPWPPRFFFFYGFTLLAHCVCIMYSIYVYMDELERTRMKGNRTYVVAFFCSDFCFDPLFMFVL